MADVKDRLASAFLRSAIAAASPTGCSQRMPADSGELVIAFPGAPVSIDPRLSTDAYGTQILQMTHASLTRRGAGVRFHDGRELTSADVRDTFAWILNPRNRSPHRSTYETIRDIETPDSRTVVFRLSETFAPFLAGMVRGIVPAGTRAAGYSPPIGAGPYRVDDYEQDTAIRLSRFEGYHGGAACIEQVVVKFLPDSNVRFLELKKGGVNLVLNGVGPDLIPAVLE